MKKTALLAAALMAVCKIASAEDGPSCRKVAEIFCANYSQDAQELIRCAEEGNFNEKEFVELLAPRARRSYGKAKSKQKVVEALKIYLNAVRREIQAAYAAIELGEISHRASLDYILAEIDVGMSMIIDDPDTASKLAKAKEIKETDKRAQEKYNAAKTTLEAAKRDAEVVQNIYTLRCAVEWIKIFQNPRNRIANCR